MTHSTILLVTNFFDIFTYLHTATITTKLSTYICLAEWGKLAITGKRKMLKDFDVCCGMDGGGFVPAHIFLEKNKTRPLDQVYGSEVTSVGGTWHKINIK